MDKQGIEQKRVQIYIPEEQHRKLRAKVALAGKTVSQWAREAIAKYLSE